ncbi:hypothetical protein [Myxococcus sp. RHSTA-1-4]|uniref:hypothetical protein n=1 Tax=Myxococcus sp. RHSTA-1-4 TaxID=2874601 RepID=UPI001CBF186F|nr:hypothetical protein [Myxococcus sp. RHSTA-1-4]MBZ4422181.1 hypothetical protein [Myxococcus sp. RHSTA-1-4]
MMISAPKQNLAVIVGAYWLVFTLQGCQPPDGHGEVGWPGEHTPRVGEPCAEPGELRCSAPPKDSRAVLRCDGGEWSPLRECAGEASCNWAGPREAYCAGP